MLINVALGYGLHNSEGSAVIFRQTSAQAMGNVPGALFEFQVFVLIIKHFLQEIVGRKGRPNFLH